MYYQFQDKFANIIIVWLIPVVLLTVIAFSLYMIRKNNQENESVKILRKRFANGEIDNDEYERMKKIIEN